MKAREALAHWKPDVKPAGAEGLDQESLRGEAILLSQVFWEFSGSCLKDQQEMKGLNHFNVDNS